MSAPTKFKDLAIGERFHFSGGTGLLADVGRPNRRENVKVSARKWRDDTGSVGRIGSVEARVWRVEE